MGEQRDGRAWRGDAAVAVAVAVGTLAVYWPVRAFSWVNFDDPQYVTRNPWVRRGLTAADVRWAFGADTFAYWHPLTWLSLQLDVSVWGVRAGPMHLENAALHAAAAALWYLLWAGMTGQRWRAAAVAGLFALHPTRVESVAWVAERKDVLCGLLTVATLLAYSRPRRSMGAAVAGLGLYALALMAKPMAVTVPAVMVLLDGWPLRRLGRGTAAAVAPYAALAAAAAAMTVAAGGQSPATPTLAQLGVRDRAATAVVGVVRYLGKLAVPTRLSIFYPYRFGEPLPVVMAAAGLVAVVTWAAWRGRARRPYVAVGWAWFLVTLVPVVGLVQSGEQAMADRFVYVAAVGPFVAVVWAAADVGGRAAGGLLLAAVVACGVGTARYLPAWRDGVSVWTWAAASNGEPDPVIDGHLAAARLRAATGASP